MRRLQLVTLVALVLIAVLIVGSLAERSRAVGSGTTELASVSSAGTQGNEGSYADTGGAISGDGRYVAFMSRATNLAPGDTNGVLDDVFVRDRQTGTTELVSMDSTGNSGTGRSRDPAISGDGRYVAFTSLASNLVPGDGNDRLDVFVRDRQTGTTERVSVDSAGFEGNWESSLPAISADGRYVAFTSFGSNLVPGDGDGTGNYFVEVFVRDRQTGTTERVSVHSAGIRSVNPSISADGRYVTFESNTVIPQPGDTWDVFVRDRQTGMTELISVDSTGIQGDGDSSSGTISGDGRYVAFTSLASNLVEADTNVAYDVFVRDRCPDGSCIGTPTPTPSPSPEPPVWDVSTGSLTVHAGDEAVVYLSVGDPDAADVVTIESVDGLPVGMTCTYYSGNPASGECRWTPTEAQLGTHLVDFVAHDTGGLQSPVHRVTIDVIAPLPTYLAIGDSFATGCSMASNPDDSEVCPKAVISYPELLWSDWARAAPGLQLIDRTRWGQTAEFFAEGAGRSIVEQALDRKPKAVTITLGANDFKYLDFEYWLVGKDKKWRESAVSTRANQVELRLEKLIRHIRSKSPDAVVFVTGYPNPFTPGECTTARWYWDLLLYNTGNRDGLNDALKRAAGKFTKTYFVPLDDKGFQRHTMASKSSWYFGTQCQLDPVTAIYCGVDKSHCDPHPNQEGAKAIADAIQRRLIVVPDF